MIILPDYVLILVQTDANYIHLKSQTLWCLSIICEMAKFNEALISFPNCGTNYIGVV